MGLQTMMSDDLRQFLTETDWAREVRGILEDFVPRFDIILAMHV